MFHKLCMFVKWFYSFTLIHWLKYLSVLSLSNSQNPNGIWVDQKVNLLIWVTFSYYHVVTEIKLQRSSKWFVDLFRPGFRLSGIVHYAFSGSYRVVCCLWGWLQALLRAEKVHSHPLYFEDKKWHFYILKGWITYDFIVPHLTSETKFMP